MKLNRAIDDGLKRLFYRLGHLVGRNPGYFIIVPTLLAALCITGFQRLRYNYDPEYLFSPSNGAGKAERDIVEHYFPTNFSSFKGTRATRLSKMGRLVVTANTKESMINTRLWDQLVYLDQVVYNVTVRHEGRDYRYEDLCAKYNGYCYENEILRLGTEVLPMVETGDLDLTYPLFFDPFTFESFVLPVFFGGVTFNEVESVDRVEAVALAYFLDQGEDWKFQVGEKWEQLFLEEVTARAPELYPDLNVSKFTSGTPGWESEKSKLSVTTTLCINIAVMTAFSFIAASMGDGVKSKPLIGFCGLVSATLASLAGFGMACYIGVDFITLNFAAPFLLLGIGLDDTYVVLSSWHRTGLKQGGKRLSLPERMGECLSDSAVSITVTSLTDFFSFMAGIITPFPCVRIFCFYTGIAVAFIYIWHITFFAGFLALAGKAEEEGRHGMFVWFYPKPKSMSKDKSLLYRAFLTGGVNPDDPLNPEDNKEHIVMAFFRDRVGGFLSTDWGRAAVLVCFACYIVLAGWGMTNIKEGLDKRNMGNYDSYVVQYYDMEDKYFKKYAYSMSLVFSGPSLDFSDPATRDKIESITKRMENSSYIDPQLTRSWLRDFLDYVERNKEYNDLDLPIDTEWEFASTLRDTYLQDLNSPSKLDVAFSEDGSRILAARFIIQGLNINTSLVEQNMVAELRELCAMLSTDELKVTVFHPFFIYIDQFLAILPQTVQTITVTAAVMMVIALLLIPSVLCSLWVAFSIVSIEVGVVGFMSLWGINLDGVALINLTMCIGFSVDFSAHICYHYIACEEETSVAPSPKARIRAALYALGLPILQGAVSTIIGVSGLAFAPSYIFVTFFKMIFLVIALGAVHGIVLLPVFLSLFGPGSCSYGKAKKALGSPSSTPPSVHKVNGGGKQRHSNAVGANHDDDDGIHSICNCTTINMGYLEDEGCASDHLPMKKVYATNSTGIVVSSSQLMIVKRHGGAGGGAAAAAAVVVGAGGGGITSGPSSPSSSSTLSSPRSVGELRRTSPTSSGRVAKKHNYHHHYQHQHHHHKKVNRTRSQIPQSSVAAAAAAAASGCGKGKRCLARTDAGPLPPIVVGDIIGSPVVNGSAAATTASSAGVEAKAPLKKAHTFPYQMLHNDTTTSPSSEDDSEPASSSRSSAASARQQQCHHRQHHHQRHARRRTTSTMKQ